MKLFGQMLIGVVTVWMSVSVCKQYIVLPPAVHGFAPYDDQGFVCLFL